MTSYAEGYIYLPIWSDDHVVKPLVNAAGQIPVIIDAITSTLDINLKTSDITLPVSEQSPLSSIQAQNYGWIGSDWQKLSMIWGYSEIYGEVEYLNDVAAGARTLTFSTVQAGEIWIIQSFCALAFQSNPSRIHLGGIIGGAGVDVICRSYPTAYVSVDILAPIVLAVDDYLTAVFDDCVSGDDIRAYATGYKMKVAE